jgi:hypothetical protein
LGYTHKNVRTPELAKNFSSHNNPAKWGTGAQFNVTEAEPERRTRHPNLLSPFLGGIGGWDRI